MSNISEFYDTEAQLGILSYMWADKTLRAMGVESLVPADFYGLDRKLFDMMYQSRGNFSLYKNPLSEEMEKRIDDGVHHRLDSPDETLFKSWLDMVRMMSRRRQLRAVNETALNKTTPTSDPDEISIEIIEDVAKINHRQDAQSDISIGDAAILSNETEEKWAAGDSFSDSVQTGYKGLDKASGGLQRGHIGILAGMESMGKTALALTIALNVARNRERVYFFSMDMHKEKVAGRLQQTVSGVSAKELRFPSDMIAKYGEDGYQDRRRRFRDAGIGLAELNPYLTINPTTGLTPVQMYSKAMMHHAIAPLDLVIFDYLGLDGSKGDNAVAEIKASLLGLKAIANHFNCAVLVLAQFSKGITNRPDRVPDNNDLKGSSDIGQFAESTWFVYRPGYYHDPISGYKTSAIEAQANWCEEQGGNAFIKIGKGRESGRGGKVILHFNEPTATFTDVERSGEHRRGKDAQGSRYNPRDQFGANS